MAQPRFRMIGARRDAQTRFLPDQIVENREFSPETTCGKRLSDVRCGPLRSGAGFRCFELHVFLNDLRVSYFHIPEFFRTNHHVGREGADIQAADLTTGIFPLRLRSLVTLRRQPLGTAVTHNGLAPLRLSMHA